jgi:hypothetical protein
LYSLLVDRLRLILNVQYLSDALFVQRFSPPLIRQPLDRFPWPQVSTSAPYVCVLWYDISVAHVAWWGP